jgi:hypothetical protein
LFDPALVHHDDQVGRRHRFHMVMRDIDGGEFVPRMQPPDLAAHLVAEIGVEVRQRLVEQQRGRLHDKRARECHALLLTAGELMWIAVSERRETRDVEDRAHARVPIRPGRFACLQPIRDVRGDGHMRPERVILKNHRHVASFGRHDRARRGQQTVADADRTPIGRHEAGEQPQGRRLPAPGWPEQAGQFTMLDGQRNTIEHESIGEPLAEVLYDDPRHDPATGLPTVPTGYARCVLQARLPDTRRAYAKATPAPYIRRPLPCSIGMSSWRYVNAFSSWRARRDSNP